MKCKKCGTEFADSFNFCPNCGKKASKREERLVLRNTDWLRYATLEELDSFLAELKVMTAEELSMWCCGMHENIRIFEIKGSYAYKFHGDNWRRSSVRGLSAEETIKEINHTINICENVDGIEISAFECNLSNNKKEEEEGITWFRTKEECITAINKIKQIVERG